MFSAIREIVRRECDGRKDFFTRDVFELAVHAIDDPRESWSVKDSSPPGDWPRSGPTGLCPMWI